MSKNESNFNPNWYELWMKQSQDFFTTAEKNLQGVFGENTKVNPEDHLKQINQWLDALKKQWEYTQLSDEQKAYKMYWDVVTNMYNDASKLLLDQWIKRSREQKPITDIHELYELWLNCCHEVYQKAMQTKAYQEAYSEFMNAALKFWQATTQK